MKWVLWVNVIVWLAHSEFSVCWEESFALWFQDLWRQINLGLSYNHQPTLFIRQNKNNSGKSHTETKHLKVPILITTRNSVILRFPSVTLLASLSSVWTWLKIQLALKITQKLRQPGEIECWWRVMVEVQPQREKQFLFSRSLCETNIYTSVFLWMHLVTHPNPISLLQPF